MSDEPVVKSKIPYQIMKFYYEVAVSKTMEQLFSGDNEYGWTEEEFRTSMIQEAISDAMQAKESGEDSRLFH